MASKASEWAAARARATALEIKALEITGVLSTERETPFTVHVDIGTRGMQPTMCLTDYRLGSLVLTVAEGLQLARWILDTYEDRP